MARHHAVTIEIRAEMGRLIASGMTIDQAARDIAERKTAAWIEATDRRRHPYRYRGKGV
jgi:hypothetical protein